MRSITLILIVLILFIFFNHDIFAQVNIERFRAGEDSTGFSGYIEIELSSRTGNVDITEIDIENQNNYLWKDMNTLFVIRSNFGWEEGKRFSNEALTHLRHIFRIKTSFQPEFFAQIDYNKEILLSFRGLVGGGVRLVIYKGKKTRFFWGTAFMFEHEKLDTNGNDKQEKTVDIIRWSNYISAYININERAQLTWTTYLQPYINNFKDIRILSDTDLIVGLSKYLSLAVGFRTRYDIQPPEEITSLDTALKTGLVLNF